LSFSIHQLIEDDLRKGSALGVGFNGFWVRREEETLDSLLLVSWGTKRTSERRSGRPGKGKKAKEKKKTSVRKEKRKKQR
jgi:hypothetical protein